MTSARTVTRRPAAGTRKRTAARPAARRRPARRPVRRTSKAAKKARRALRPATWWPPLLVVLAVVVGLAWDADQPEITALAPAPWSRCTLAGSGIHLTGEQIGNAETIAAVARDRGLPERAVVIALATAMQESRLRNIDYGDRDSLGLFQQRPSQGWGTPEQVQVPVYAAGKFYDHLVQVPNWQQMRLTDAAQLVQRSGYPEAYQKHEPMAAALAAALTDDSVACR